MRNPSRSTLARVLLGFVACLLLLVPACERKSPTAAPAPRPVVIAIDQNPTSLDPIRVLDIHSHMVAGAIHAPLVLTDVDGKFRHVIAKRVEMAPDGLICQIELDPDARFWDGSPVTPGDVVFTLERLRRSAHPHKWILERIVGCGEFDAGEAEHIAGLEVTGPRSLFVRFSEPDPQFPWFIASGLTAIVKAGSDNAGAEPFDAQIIGCGPFKPERLEAGSRFVLTRNDGFPNPTRVSSLEFSVISDSQNQLQALAAGRVDVVRLRGAMLGEACERGSDGDLTPRSRFQDVRLVTAPSNELTFVLWNWARSPLDGVSANAHRDWLAALSEALSRSDLVQRLYLGQAVPAESVVPQAALPTSFAWPAPAQAELAVSRPLTLLTANDPDSRRLASYFQERARAAGLPVQTTSVELGQLVQRLLGGDYELALFWIEQQIPSGPIPWTQFFREDSPFAAIGQPVNGIRDAVTAARGALNANDRQSAYEDLVASIDAEQSAWLPVVSRNTVLMVSDRLEGAILDRNGVIYWTNLTIRE